MEPIGAIALSIALASAATTGKTIVTEAVKDAYEQLKKVIKKRYPKVSIKAVQERPNSVHRRAALEEGLGEAGANNDPNLHSLAGQLIESIKEFAPETASAIAVSLEDVTAANLILNRVESSGSAVRVKGGIFTGDIKMEGIRGGVGAALPANEQPDTASARALVSDDIDGLTPVIELNVPYVGGSISISNVQVAVYRTEIQHIRKVRWRNLEHVSYAVLSDSDASRHKFVEDICDALSGAFGDKYERFTMLFSSDTRAVDGGNIVVHAIESPRAKFAALLRERQIEFVKTAMALSDGDETTRAARRQAIADEVARRAESWAGWSFQVKIDFSSEPSALEVLYDPETRFISLTCAEAYSLDPADYPDHLKSTSELLNFIAASFRTRIGYFGDVSWVANDFRLMKVMMRLLDHEPIDLAAVRINVGDCEEWDYSNPSFEGEIGARLNRPR